MKRFISTKTALVVLGLAAPGLALAEARIDVGQTPMEVDVDLNLEIIVPEILIFKVGDLGAFVNTVTWTYDATGYANPTDNGVFAGPVPFVPGSSTVTPTDDEADNAGNGGGVIDVYAFGNSGDINITSSSSNGDTLSNGTETIPLSDISVAGPSHPTAGASNGLNGGTAGAVIASGNVAELDDEWTYTYAPTTNPAAGTYTTTITYTASMP